MSVELDINPFHFDSWNKLSTITDDIVTDVTPDVITVKNAIILPGHPRSPRGLMALSGAYYPEGHHIPEAAYHRMAGKILQLGVEDLSEVSPELARPQTKLPAGIWGGHIFAKKSYGHILLETFSRLWYILDNTDLPVYVTVASPEEFQWFCEHFACLDLPFDRLRPVLQTASVEELIIPSQSFLVSYGGGPSFTDSIKRISPKLTDKNTAQNMLYFSRAGYAGRGHRTIVGEVFLESALKEAGVTICRLEEFTFAEKLDLLARHKHISGFTGSGHHHNIFTENKRVSYITNGLATFKMRTYLAHEMLVGNDVIISHFPEYFQSFADGYWKKAMNFWGEGPQLVDFQNVLDHFYHIGFLKTRIRFEVTREMRAAMRAELLQSMEASLKFSGRVEKNEQKIRNHMEMRLKTVGLGEAHIK